jgi:hypothetical protein
MPSWVAMKSGPDANNLPFKYQFTVNFIGSNFELDTLDLVLYRCCKTQSTPPLGLNY